MFTASIARPDALQSLRLRAMVAEALLHGVRVAWFGTGDVDVESGTVTYDILDDKGHPYTVQAGCPAILMSPVKPRNLAERDCLDWFRMRSRVTHGPVPKKLEAAQLLLDTDVSAHVIPFAVVPVDDPCPTVLAFLDRYGRIVLKPNVNGLSGGGISFLARDGDHIAWQTGSTRDRLSRDEAVARVSDKASRYEHIVQAFVLSRARGNRTFDVRVHTHKDGRGEWAHVRTYVRLSEEGLLVSNTGQGGYQGDVDNFFANTVSTPPVVDRIRDLGLAASRAIEARTGESLDELGVDILVDPKLRLWIAEINSRPMSRYHEFDRAKFAIEYSIYLRDVWNPRMHEDPIRAVGG